ncbi:MAG: LysM peptidoglycan-binding domain-containing protein [Syntrophales bacterium]
MDKDPEVDIVDLADTLKKEEPKLEGNGFDKTYDYEPRFFNRTEKALLIAGAVVLVISIGVFLTSGGIYLSKTDFNALIKRVDRIEERLAEIERKPKYHVVAPGETLPLIAKKYGLTVDELLNFNGMTPRQPIQPGQKLLVSATKGS